MTVAGATAWSATSWRANVIACAGLQSDRVAAMTGDAGNERIVPFRGDYYTLTADARSLCAGLIYPVPDPRFPFLGVHFTKRIDGKVWAGPNAVLAFAREGYARRDISPRQLAGTLAYRGFQRLACKYWRTGLAEMWRDFSKRAFLAEMRATCRRCGATRSSSGRPASARRRSRDGTMVDDFSLGGSGHVIHVRNAPSPAATASLAIGRELAERAIDRFELGGARRPESRGAPRNRQVSVSCTPGGHSSRHDRRDRRPWRQSERGATEPTHPVPAICAGGDHLAEIQRPTLARRAIVRNGTSDRKSRASPPLAPRWPPSLLLRDQAKSTGLTGPGIDAGPSGGLGAPATRSSGWGTLRPPSRNASVLVRVLERPAAVRLAPVGHERDCVGDPIVRPRPRHPEGTPAHGARRSTTMAGRRTS